MLEAEQLNDSILASIGSVIAPLFAPLGWGDWKMAVAAVTGLIAKENVVGTLVFCLDSAKLQRTDRKSGDSSQEAYLP